MPHSGKAYDDINLAKPRSTPQSSSPFPCYDVLFEERGELLKKNSLGELLVEGAVSSGDVKGETVGHEGAVGTVGAVASAGCVGAFF